MKHKIKPSELTLSLNVTGLLDTDKGIQETTLQTFHMDTRPALECQTARYERIKLRKSGLQIVYIVLDDFGNRYWTWDCPDVLGQLNECLANLDDFYPVIGARLDCHTQTFEGIQMEETS